MKKIIHFFYLGFFILWVLCAYLSAEPQRGGHFGISAGAFPIFWGFNAYRAGAEIGYRTERIAFVAEVAYGHTSSESESREDYGYYSYFYSTKTTFTSVPVSASLLYIAQLSENFSATVGVGLGYYKIKMKEKTTYQYDSYSETYTDEEETKGYAPHVSLGIESSISRGLSIFGEVKQIVGKLKSEEKEAGYSIKEIYPFGGPEIRVGFRFHF